MKQAIIVRVVCFSVIKHILRAEELSVALPAGAKGSDLDKHIRAMAGGRLDGIPLRLALNQQFVSSDSELSDGDEVALIPPVQGG